MGKHLEDQQRVAADLKEVVVATDRGQLEHIAPDLGEQLLGRRHRRRAVGLHRMCGCCGLPLGEPPPVDLARGRGGQRRQRLKAMRDHLGRQQLHQPAAHLGVGRQLALGLQIRHQLDMLVSVAHGADGGAGDGRVLVQRRLDLARLDAVAADLDLVVGPPHELQVAVGQRANQIASFIEASRFRG